MMHRRKRKHEDGINILIDSESAFSQAGANKKHVRRSFGGVSSYDWQSRMDGFDGFKFSETTKAPKSRRSMGTSEEFKATVMKELEPEHPPSQVDIDDHSSGDEGSMNTTSINIGADESLVKCGNTNTDPPHPHPHPHHTVERHSAGPEGYWSTEIGQDLAAIYNIPAMTNIASAKRRKKNKSTESRPKNEGSALKLVMPSENEENEDATNVVIDSSPISTSNLSRVPVKQGMHVELSEEEKEVTIAAGQDTPEKVPPKTTRRLNSSSIIESQAGNGNKPHILCSDDPPSPSPEIFTASPDSSPEPLPVGAGKPKVSEWVRNIQLDNVTPDKMLAKEGEKTPDDSARKKRPKYLRGGLADRLHRLIAREKSAVTFFNHRQSTGQNQPAAGQTLLVTVQHLSTDWSLFIAKCLVIREQGDSKLGREEINVIFNKHQVKTLCLKERSVVRIYPPWQKLSLGSRGTVVLCTHFCKSEERSSDMEQSEACESSDLPQTVYHAEFKCPCENGRRMPRGTCPSQLENHTLPSQSNEDCESQSSHGERKLVMMTAESSQTTISESILDSVEKRGGCTAVNVGFRAVIQRIYSHNTGYMQTQATENRRPVNRRWYALLEDIHGSFCVIQLPDSAKSQKPWSVFIEEGEGKMCTFTGLRVQQRLIRVRWPGLFTMIDSVWQPELIVPPRNHSQDSFESEGGAPLPVSPGFCYCMLASPGETEFTLSPSSTQGPPSLYKPPNWQPIPASLSHHGDESRVSFVGRVLYRYNPSHEKGDTCVGESCWYVTDEFLQRQQQSDTFQRGYACISINPDQQSTELQVHGDQQILAFRDITLTKGKFCATMYSQVSSVPASLHHLVRPLQTIKVTLPYLQFLMDLRKHDLVTICERVSAVVEDEAYSWMECDKCQSDQLITSSVDSVSMYCSRCEQNVTDAVTRMQLTVLLPAPSSLTQDHLKVTLLESTIKSLLPEESEDDGYDLQCVLGQRLGPLSCHVTAITTTSIILQEVQVLT